MVGASPSAKAVMDGLGKLNRNDSFLSNNSRGSGAGSLAMSNDPDEQPRFQKPENTGSSGGIAEL